MINRRRPLNIAVIIVIIILIIASFTAMSRYEKYIGGLWAGDPSFLKKSQLRDLQLFIAPSEKGIRTGYLIMTDLNNNFISNQVVEIRERSPSRRWWTALKSVFKTTGDTYTVDHVDFDYDGNSGGPPPMPGRMKMTVSILDGTLTLYDDEKVYAFMSKDHTASTAAITEWNS